MNRISSLTETVIYEQFARIGKAIATPARLELLNILSQGPRNVESLAKEASLGITNASQHLKALRLAGLVVAEKSGLFVTYRLSDDRVCQFLESLRHLAESQLAEVRELKAGQSDSDGIELVDRKTLLRRVKNGSATVLDVRPHEEYVAGHFPGAISVPLKELKRRLSELPKGKEVVAYCRGPYCIMAVEAVELLRSHGFRAKRFKESVQEWRAEGLRVATGE